MNGLASIYISQRKFAEAEVIFKDCLARRKALFGPRHPETLESVSNLQVVYMMQGKHTEAAAVQSQMM